MSYINLQQTNRKIIPFYDSLLKETWKHFLNYDKIYGQEDYRSVYFGTLVSSILWTISQLEIFSNHIPNPIICNRFDNLEESSFAQILVQYDTINRKTFVFDTMALSEDFMNSICIEVFKKQFNTYKESIDEITKSIFSGGQDKLNILYSLYLVRNSLHNNGFIKRKIQEFDLTIETKTYSFRNNSQITFSGWDNLHILIQKLLETIVEIIENPIIKNITKIKHTNALDSDTGVLINNNNNQMKI